MMTKDEMRRKLELFFTPDQLEAYKLVHPNLGGLSYAEAAGRLHIKEGALRSRLARMKEAYPYAFRWQKMEKEKLQKMGNLNAIYGGYKGVAKRENTEFELTKEEVYEIIQLPCSVCEKEPRDEAITNDGRYFKHNYLQRTSIAEGYTYLNTISVCPRHSGKVWRR
jgi:hypothetical protein